jgi:hypothetical protein
MDRDFPETHAASLLITLPLLQIGSGPHPMNRHDDDDDGDDDDGDDDEELEQQRDGSTNQLDCGCGEIFDGGC